MSNSESAALLLSEVVATSTSVAATRSRISKVELLAAVLQHADASERVVLTFFLAGRLRQRRTGVGWRSVQTPPEAADRARLTVLEVDQVCQELSELSGAGSASARTATLAALLSRATSAEQEWLASALTGALRQGASDALVTEAIAKATGRPLASVRRAVMLAGGNDGVVRAAFSPEADALESIGLDVGRPVMPMLASSAPTVSEALQKLGGDAYVETKLDGIRIQVHRDGDAITIASRSLDDLSHRLPAVTAAALALASDRFVLDGEAMLVDHQGRPRPFQETAARSASQDHDTEVEQHLQPFFFDLLHLDGSDLLDSPTQVRLEALDRLVPADQRVRRILTADPEVAEEFAAQAVREGHEGVVLKETSAPYAAGRRGSSWIKVKPVHTLDLVVLAVERGSGRRRGTLSNIHLGARDPERPGELIMLGKTFKGMTDEMLAWQTERFTELALSPAELEQPWVVRLRPEQVVEIAYDGIQRSSRYPGGVALRFARVVRYRDDKPPEEADDIATIRRRHAGLTEPDD